MQSNSIEQLLAQYGSDLLRMLTVDCPEHIDHLAEALEESMQNRRQVFICGNGGSAGNANHMANDLIYLDGADGGGLRVEALTANQSVMTCLGNDLGYEQIFSKQLEVKAGRDDLLIVLSGSGNSKNVIRALETGEALGMKTFAILGYSGGHCKTLCQYPIHFPVNDMQVAEDLQMVVAHVCMKYLKSCCLSKGDLDG